MTCVNGAVTSSYTYGADGLRRQMTANGATTDYVLDNSMFVRERNHATGTNIATYLVGARGPEYRRDDVAGTVRWYLYDGLGSVLGEVDPNGNLTSTRKYDVYGAVRGGNNPGGSSRHKFVGSLGHPSDDETGLIYMRARYYDPAVGRFASEDPGRDGENWYVYAINSPTNVFDADGKIPQWLTDILAWCGKAIVRAAITSFVLYLLKNQIISTKIALGRMLDNWANSLIAGGRAQAALGARQIEEGEAQDCTPGGFVVAGLNYGSGALNEMSAWSKVALGVTVKTIAGYLLSGVDDSFGDVARLE